MIYQMIWGRSSGCCAQGPGAGKVQACGTQGDPLTCRVRGSSVGSDGYQPVILCVGLIVDSGRVVN